VNLKAFNKFCQSLPATTHVVQWGGADVWKVGGKVFAIGSFEEGEEGYSFKTTPMDFEILKGQKGLRGAPYLASRGLKWIQHYAEPGLNDKQLRNYLELSHRIVASGLSKKRRLELGLNIEPERGLR
jgi:predicted DNA-binding protein (MmcQ/YjbR family)